MEKDKIAYEQLIEGISSYVNKCVENSNSDKTVSGIVKKIYDDDEGYSVLINGTMYDNVPSIGGTCKVNEIVRILIPQNNYGNMCILKGGSGGSSSGGGSDVRVTVEQTEGTHIATITVNGNENKLYAPNGSGSGGTKDYAQLVNKPKINNVELSGNKTLTDLGVPSTLSQLTSDSTHRTVTDAEKSSWNNKANISDIPTKLSELTSDTTHRTVTDVEKENWNNSVKSVGLTVPSGLKVENSPITSSGNIGVSFEEGYSIPTNEKQEIWDDTKDKVDILRSNSYTNGSVLNLIKNNAVNAQFEFPYQNGNSVYVETLYYLKLDNDGEVLNKVVFYDTFSDKSYATKEQQIEYVNNIIFNMSVGETKNIEFVAEDGTPYYKPNLYPAPFYYYVTEVTKLENGDWATNIPNVYIGGRYFFKTIKEAIDEKQMKITSDSKLDYSLISNTPKIPSVLTDLNNDLIELETENINFSTIVK